MRSFGHAASKTLVVSLTVVTLAHPPSAEARKGLLGALVGAGAVTAARATIGPRNYDSSTLRPEELKSCLILAHDLDEQTGVLTGKRSRIESSRADLQNAIQVFADDAKKPVQARSVKQPFDTRKAALLAREKALNEEIEHFNSEANSAKRKQADFSANCAGKKYFSADLSDVASNLPFDISAYTSK